jgi:DNA-directed RNA polymerase subunit RPC12/RpoP
VYRYRGVWVRFGFRNKTGFHECPQCKSRSVWKADPYGTLESFLYRFLKLSPYRCARCDRRFMDSKLPAQGTPLPFTRRLILRARSTASRLLHRAPVEQGLQLSMILRAPVSTPADRSMQSPFKSPSAAGERANLPEKSGLPA